MENLGLLVGNLQNIRNEYSYTTGKTNAIFDIVDANGNQYTGINAYGSSEEILRRGQGTVCIRYALSLRSKFANQMTGESVFSLYAKRVGYIHPMDMQNIHLKSGFEITGPLAENPVFNQENGMPVVDIKINMPRRSNGKTYNDILCIRLRRPSTIEMIQGCQIGSIVTVHGDIIPLPQISQGNNFSAVSIDATMLQVVSQIQQSNFNNTMMSQDQSAGMPSQPFGGNPTVTTGETINTNPVGTPGVTPAGMPSQPFGGNPTVTTGQTMNTNPVGTPGVAPTSMPGQPTGMPSQPFGGNPTVTMGETVNTNPVGTPGVAPTGMPAQPTGMPSQPFGGNTTVTTGQTMNTNPVGTPGVAPTGMPVQPTGMPSQPFGGNPTVTTGQTINTNPVGTPGVAPAGMPGQPAGMPSQPFGGNTTTSYVASGTQTSTQGQSFGANQPYYSEAGAQI